MAPTTTTLRAAALAARLRARVKASADGWHCVRTDAEVDLHRARIWNANGRLDAMRRAGVADDPRKAR